MPRLELVIGNKNYSTWSMPRWVLMRRAGIVLEESGRRLNAHAHCPLSVMRLAGRRAEPPPAARPLPVAGRRSPVTRS